MSISLNPPTHCPNCRGRIILEARYDTHSYIIRHRDILDAGNCGYEGTEYGGSDGIERPIGVSALSQSPNQYTVASTSVTTTTGSYLTSDDVDRLYDELLSGRNNGLVYQQRDGESLTNEQRLHRDGKKIVDGKIVSIMDKNG